MIDSVPTTLPVPARLIGETFYVPLAVRTLMPWWPTLTKETCGIDNVDNATFAFSFSPSNKSLILLPTALRLLFLGKT